MRTFSSGTDPGKTISIAVMGVVFEVPESKVFQPQDPYHGKS